MAGRTQTTDVPLPYTPKDDATLLRGLTFLNTRDVATAGRLTRMLAELGGRVVEKPMLTFLPPESWQPFDDRLGQLQEGEWVIFTSATAVRSTVERLTELGKDTHVLAGAKIAAVGKSTATALQNARLAVDLVPERFQADELLIALIPLLEPGAKIWFPRAEKGREVLVEGLREKNFQVDVTPVYRTVAPEGGLGQAAQFLREGEINWLLFTSSSTVTNFIHMLGKEPDGDKIARQCRVGCIGEVTAETAREHGFNVEVVPERQDLVGLVEALSAFVRSDNGRG